MEGKVLGVDCGGGDGVLDDHKYISGMSTIFVANIQEVKDRVSQMEFIFCRQLFPHFQDKSKLTQARIADAVKANEDEWRKREAGLLRQLEELSCGKRLAEDKLLQLGISLEEMKGKLTHAEQLVAIHESEKKQSLGRLEEEMRKDEVIRRLEREIEEKAAEIAREREAHQRLLLQLESKDKELDVMQSMHKDHKREIEEKAAEVAREREAHKRLLLQFELKDKDLSLGQSKQKDLEREIEEKAAEVAREREEHQRLLLQLESKDKELDVMQREHNNLIKRYNEKKAENKHLKVKYEYALRKVDGNHGSNSLVDTLEDQKGIESTPSKRKLEDLELEHTNKECVQAASKTRDLKGPNSCIKTQAVEHASSDRGPFGNSRLAPPSRPTNSLPKNDACGSKREANVDIPVLHWRGTRARKEIGLADPHDDFLDTPLEEVKNKIRNPTTPAASPPRDMEFNNSDDETQDINAATQRLNTMPNMSAPKQQNQISIQPPKKEFKYRESVRKKADRENLKGVECKQCKKFYDAVLPDGRVNGDGVGSTSLRCEHHDGVSRHRYRYAPPLTPEGFWNIGFESEM